MSADRLAELLRQRALLQGHVAWLDREIDAVTSQPAATDPAVLPPRTGAMTSGVPRASAPSAPASFATGATAAEAVLPAASPARSSPALAPATPRVAIEADAILDEYRVAPDALKTGVRQGCFLYLILAFAVLGLGVTALYFTIGRR